MKETARISKLFVDLYNGSPWLDVNIVTSLGKITSQQAANKIAPNCNSIWEILNHIIGWRKEILKLVQDVKTIPPKNNFFEPVSVMTDEAWIETLMQLSQSQALWIDFLQKLRGKDLNLNFERNNFTYYEHIHGILQHDAYHLGQIVLLAKLSEKEKVIGDKE